MDDTNNSEVRHHGENINVLSMTKVNCILIVFKYNHIRKHKILCTLGAMYSWELIITLSDSFLQKKVHLYIYTKPLGEIIINAS